MLLLNIAGVLLAFFAWITWSKMRSPKSEADDKFDLKNTQPYPDAKIKGAAKYRITMSLKTQDRQNWLTVDKNYKEQHEIRAEFLRNQRSMMVQCLPQAREACEETLQEVATFLCGRYPSMFEKDASPSGTVIKNRETGETFPTERFSEEMSPLEIASKLAMEDLTILLKNDDGEHYM